MDMKNVVMVFFAIVIFLTIIGIATPELPFDIDLSIGIIIIIFSLIAIASIWFSRNKRYYPY